jgi:isopenicillin N synthase-like dioxygenase
MNSLYSVPVIDVAPFLANDQVETKKIIQQVNRALERIGFLVLTGHGIDPELQDRTLQVAQAFFDLPEDEKLRYHNVPGTFMGYNPLAAERVAYSHGIETAPDLKANYTLEPLVIDERDPYYTSPTGRQMFQPNVWPVRPVEFRPTLTAYYRAAEALTKTLMELFALALELPREYFTDKIDKAVSFLRVLDYPALTTPPLPNQFRIGPHSDYGTLTLVTADGPGLQVRTAAGAWEDVPYVPGGIQVNIGDMLERWTNDKWVSTQHRVLVPESPEARRQRRQAIAFFLMANYDAVIEPVATTISPTRPPKYEPITAGEEMMAKISRQYSREGEVIEDLRERVIQQ